MMSFKEGEGEGQGWKGGRKDGRREEGGREGGREEGRGWGGGSEGGGERGAPFEALKSRFSLILCDATSKNENMYVNVFYVTPAPPHAPYLVFLLPSSFSIYVRMVMLNMMRECVRGCLFVSVCF
jgi:hypothetical protein